MNSDDEYVKMALNYRKEDCQQIGDDYARWIRVPGYATPGGDPVWRCSKCGKGIHVYGIEHGSYGADVADGQWKACPNCGRRIVEGNNG